MIIALHLIDSGCTVGRKDELAPLHFGRLELLSLFEYQIWPFLWLNAIDAGISVN